MSTADLLAQARSHLEAGQPWKARDLLLARVEATEDTEALVQLGYVLHGMGDLPRAGAMWFAAGVKGPEADVAVAAWREQADDDFAAMWRSLPAGVRAEPRSPRVEALRAKAVLADPRLESPEEPVVRPGELTAPPDLEPAGGGVDAAQVIGWVVAAAFVVCAVIGVVTVLGWIVPS
ncbi:hypothetical protein H9L10_14805 [Phycicoccus endophyticus]|uniref:Tetratricopeptide repeat protein n=1 Tax=Phycicoccus endophyticus TaxID=1690220 RepID=A0A7G9R1F9_9MICO|nr:hypothetical protein [Phycicoccus endophyticus]NHI18779.1 hypothetical protein [Phycicoccus endophyticus]QNN49434.1 hypothetical protein H9L10_14805 [Phycicoccus endophyticus]